MTTRRTLPPLSAPQRPEATRAHVHVHAREGAPAGIGHNGLDAAAVEVVRSSIRRVRAIQREIDALNKDKGAVYEALKALGIDPGLVRKVAYRLTLSRAEVEAIRERDEQLALLWAATADMLDEFAAEDAVPDTSEAKEA